MKFSITSRSREMKKIMDYDWKKKIFKKKFFKIFFKCAKRQCRKNWRTFECRFAQKFWNSVILWPFYSKFLVPKSGRGVSLKMAPLRPPIRKIQLKMTIFWKEAISKYRKIGPIELKKSTPSRFLPQCRKTHFYPPTRGVPSFTVCYRETQNYPYNWGSAP